MRLWSLHPQYLDPQGLVALWREALLAQAVLRGKTSGYKHHPQLERFTVAQFASPCDQLLSRVDTSRKPSAAATRSIEARSGRFARCIEFP